MNHYTLNYLPCSGKRVTVPEHAMLKNLLQANVKTMVDHLRVSARSVRNTNPLIKIMNGFILNHNNPDEVWLTNRIRGDINSKAIGITTDVSKGKDIDPILFGYITDEYVVTRQDKFPDNDDWENWEPIRIEHHSYDNLNMDFIDNESLGWGDAVISIDVGLLALQYWYWRNNTMDDESKDRAHNWLIQYPIANACKGYLEHALHNRLSKLWAGSPLEPYDHGLGWVTLVNPNTLFKRYAKKLKKKMRNSGLSLGDYLKSIQLIDRDVFQLLASTDGWLGMLPNRWLITKIDAGILNNVFLNWDYLGIVNYQRWAQKHSRDLRMSKNSGSFKQRPDVEHELNVYVDRINVLAK